MQAQQREMKCGMEAVNNTTQTIYLLNERGTVTRGQICEAHDFCLGLVRTGPEPAD